LPVLLASAFLARLVTEHRPELDKAFEAAHDLAYGLAKL
jgi:hypothetical protein